MNDMWDPNTWTEEPHEHRIYSDDRAQQWAIVDQEDYQWFSQWRWGIKRSKGWAGKLYVYRCTNNTMNYVKFHNRSLYLHVEIMKRTGIAPPSPLHTIADHRNGKSLDCRRANLRWATRQMNRRNIYGSEPMDLEELCKTGGAVSLNL